MMWMGLLPFSPALGWIPSGSETARTVAAIALPAIPAYAGTAPVTVDILLEALAARVKALAGALSPEAAEIAVRTMDAAGMLDGVAWTAAARADPLAAAIRNNPAFREHLSLLGVTPELPATATPAMLSAIEEDDRLQDLDAWIDAMTATPR